MLTGLNHITLAVSNIDKSLTFYAQVLGFEAHVKWDSGAYLSLGDLWLCLSLDHVDNRQDYTHIAFSVDASDFNAVSQSIKNAGAIEWKQNNSEGESLYIFDPDQHKLEVHCGDLQSRLQSLKSHPYSGLEWLS